MFDRSIIETDNFLNVSLSAKAIYFLLGMEADDEGFVSPNRVVRLYGGEKGDIKNLIDVGLIIPFRTGVVVITDWNQNNWLDNRRIKPTQYQKEKKMLVLTSGRKYELSNGLASAQLEERSIEENRIEEDSIGEGDTPAEISRDFFIKGKYFDEYLDKFSTIKNRSTVQNEFDKFILYWTEPNGSGKKQRWQQQPTFDVKRRLVTWLGKMNNFNRPIKQRVVL